MTAALTSGTRSEKETVYCSWRSLTGLVDCSALGASGENFFTITAINGQRISTVAFTTTVAMVVTNVDDVAQIRIGGGQQTQQPVPEPTTMLLLGTGLFGVAAKVRKRRKSKTA